jgi:hypothetical protein
MEREREREKKRKKEKSDEVAKIDSNRGRRKGTQIDWFPQICSFTYL